MVSPELSAETHQLQALLDDLSAKLSAISPEQRKIIESDLQMLDARVRKISYLSTHPVQIIDELRESEALFHAVWDITMDAMALSDQQGTVIAANPAYCQLYGYSMEEIVGKDFAVIFAEPDREWARQQYQQVFHSSTVPPQFESTIERKDRTVRVVESRIVFIERGGKREAMLSIIRDITEQKNAQERVSQELFQRSQVEEELRQSEAQLRESQLIYRAIGESIDYGIWISAPDGRNLYASQSFLDLLGITQEECSGYGWGKWLHPDDAERTIEAWKECIRTGGVWDIEHRFLGKDGQYHPILARGVPVRSERGDIIYWAGINLDISRLKDAEQARISGQTQLELQRRILEQREQERQQIARDIHDGPIQTLVSAIFNIQMAKEAIDNPHLQVEFNQLGQQLKNAVQELRDVVNELRPPSILRFGLTRAIRIHAEDFRERHPALRLELTLPDETNGLSEETSLTFFRIYQEALNNISRHAGATNAAVRLSVADVLATLEVSDNGRGFTPDILGDQTARGHYGMSGMKERAEAAGGTFQVWSEPGNGTIIRACLPV